MALPRRALVITVSVLSLLVIAALFTGKRRADAKADSVKAAAEAAKAPKPVLSDTGPDYFGGRGPLPVKGAIVVRDTLVISVKAAAQAAAWQMVPLSTEIGGRIAQLPVRENDAVPAGALLLALDTTEFVFALRDAQTGLAIAMANYRAEILSDHRITDPALRASRDSAARMKNRVSEADNRLLKAQMDYERSRLRAPFSGRIADIKVVAGQRIGGGTQVMTLLDLDPIKVDVQVLEGQVGYLRRGAKARVVFAAFPDEEFEGRIEVINPIVDQNTRMARVTVTVPNPRGRFLPGFFARARLDALKFPNRIIVPRAAILQRDNPPRLLVMVCKPEGDHFITDWRYVTLGQGNEDVVEILDNPDTKMVAPGEIVLIDGHYTIQHDTRVRIVNMAELAARLPPSTKGNGAETRPPSCAHGVGSSPPLG